MKKLAFIFSLFVALVGLNANAAMYIVGDAPFGGWNPANGVEMTLSNDGVTYTYDATLTSPDVWFIFAEAIGDWNTVNANRYDSGLTTDLTVTAGVEFTPVKGNTNKSFKFSGTVGNTYTFTFNPTTMKAKVDGYVEPITEFVYTVAGEPASVFGTEWDTNNTDNDMTLDETDGLYKLVKNGVVIAGGLNLQYKVVQNHGWGTNWGKTPNGDNQDYLFNESGTYNLTFIFDLENETVSLNAVKVEDGPVVEDSYTVAGTTNLFGSYWEPTDEANDMVLGEDGIYTWTKNNVVFEDVDTIEFKVVKNHSWGLSWPENNWWYRVAEAGTYDFVITFNPETYEITFNATKQGEEPPVEEDTYTVAGTENLFGSFWNPADEANDMVKGEDGIYTWTKNNVVFEAVDTIEFKVVKNHSWDVASWPENNWWYQVPSEGTYDFVITFNPETNEVTFNATKQGEEPVDDTYTVAGTENLFGSFWNPADEANDMVKGEDGIYTWTKTGVVFEDVDTIEFKVVKNHDWDAGSWPENNWWYRVASEGTYDFVITFNPETNEVTFNATKQGEEPTEMVYTVVGPTYIFGTNWDATDTNNDMVKGEDGVYTWSKEEVTLYDDFEFKVVGDHDYAIYEWPMGMDNNWHATVEEEGIYTIEITFNPEAEEADRITCTLTKTGDVEPIEHTYTVAGTENLCGSFWNPADEANDMVKGEDGIYTWTKDGVALEAEEVIEFKVVEDHSWDYSAWPSSNWYFKAEEAGNYNIVITFDPTADDMNKITFTATLVPSFIRGDVDMDGTVGIGDVTALIDYILSHNPEGVSVEAADCDQDDNVGIGDVTALIDYILSKVW